jgi:hypothetical protein
VRNPGRRATAASAQARTKVVETPPRIVASAEARAKLQRREKLTKEETNLLILAIPRKERRKLKIHTTVIPSEIKALKTMKVVEKPLTQYTGNTAQHQQHYEANLRAKMRKEGTFYSEGHKLLQELERDNRRIKRQEREAKDAARRARFDARRKGL